MDPELFNIASEKWRKEHPFEARFSDNVRAALAANDTHNAHNTHNAIKNADLQASSMQDIVRRSHKMVRQHLESMIEDNPPQAYGNWTVDELIQRLSILENYRG